MTRQPIAEVGALPARGLHVRLGSGHRPMTLSLEALDRLRRALHEWESRADLRWVAFTAASTTTFLAGADFRELLPLDGQGAYAFSGIGQGLFRRMRHSRLWLVACVEGACMGGGLDFVLACDYRIASPAARFAHPGPRLGFFTGWGGTASLPRRSGAAIPVLLSGAALAAREALRAGWIEEVAPDPLRRAALRARRSATTDLARLKALGLVAGLPLSVALTAERLLALEPRGDE